MKPRLESADLTTEDLFIWGDRWGGFRTLECTTLATFSKSGDRRAAELMFRLVSPCPSCGFHVWRWFWSEQDGGTVWERCRNCGNIRSAGGTYDITNFA